MTHEYRSFSYEEYKLHNDKLHAEMEKEGIDMLLLSTPENIYYSTCYRSWYTSSLFRPVYVLVPREGDPAIILRINEKTTVEYTSHTPRVYVWGTVTRNLGKLDGKEPIELVDKVIKDIQPDTKTIGLEAGDGMQYFWSVKLLDEIIKSQPAIEFTDGSKAIQKARMIKTDWEISRIREVCRVTEEAILETGKTIVAGKTTEKDVARGIATRMTEKGVDKISYLTVTSGIDKYCTFNTYATDRVIQKGEYVLVDISGHIDGYASDMTRVFYLGKAPDVERRMAQTASDCVVIAKEAMKPGVPVSEINKICEGVIKSSEFGDFVIHSSGHAIGLNVVEYPTIDDGAVEKLQKNMVFAVENGVYPFDLEKGVESIYLSFRMEDEVLITEDGAEWITGPGEPLIEIDC